MAGEVMETALTETRPLSEAEKVHWLGLLQATIGRPSEAMLNLARERSAALAQLPDSRWDAIEVLLGLPITVVTDVTRGNLSALASTQCPQGALTWMSVGNSPLLPGPGGLGGLAQPLLHLSRFDKFSS
ncbi:hypothetical protein AB0B45_46420 [Nonomuraea sp. NPDC049152]|uniref:hypothetical protein n=1 Tax=Nonomuraea sp. NPDC049152 TaxID=3154350 RepID=UPI0033D496E2